MRALVLIGLLLGACEDTVPQSLADAANTDAAPTDMKSPDLAGPDLAGPIEFADFVISLIDTQTADTTLPTPFADKVFTDSMDPAKFAPLFP